MKQRTSPFLSNRRPIIAATGMLALACLLAGCDDASQTGAGDTAYTTPPDWSTVCLGRVMIDAPASVEMSATRAEYRDAYGFAGIEDVGGGHGPTWSNVRIVETVPTDVKGYDKVYQGALPRYLSATARESILKARSVKMRDWDRQIKSGTPDEIASAQQSMDKAKKDWVRDIYFGKVTGQANVAEKNAFAIRLRDHYSIGYLDETDHRVRLFEGNLSQVLPESPEAAAEEYRYYRRIYHRRLPTDIPTTPGFCTSFGFIDEPVQPDADAKVDIPFRMAKYPNLLFKLTIEPADADDPRNIQKMPRMNADNAKLELIGIKDSYGPVRETILGAPGRTVGQEYGPNCSRTSCRPADQAYDFEAETYGTPGRPDQPHLILHMVAATSDDYKLTRQYIPSEPSYNKPDRPGLSGHVPPPYKQGREIFEQVLRSIRTRPGAFAPATPASGAPPSGAKK